MPNATPRANARTLPEANRDAAIIERVNRRYNQPGLRERGLKILADQQATLAATETAALNQPASTEPTPRAVNLRDLSDDLSLVRDLIEVAYMAANSLEIGRDPLTRLLDLISDRLADNLDRIREARS